MNAIATSVVPIHYAKTTLARTHVLATLDILALDITIVKVSLFCMNYIASPIRNPHLSCYMVLVDKYRCNMEIDQIVYHICISVP